MRRLVPLCTGRITLRNGKNRRSKGGSIGPALIIRIAAPADIAPLAELARETYVHAFGHTFLPADLAAHLEQHLSPNCVAEMLNQDRVLLALLGTRIVGYIQFGETNSSLGQAGDKEIRRLYVYPAHQNQGCGSALMRSALADPAMAGAASIFLDVWEHNHGARRFYTRFGFETAGVRPFEVESGAETSLDLIMVRRLVETQGVRKHDAAVARKTKLNLSGEPRSSSAECRWPRTSCRSGWRGTSFSPLYR